MSGTHEGQPVDEATEARVVAEVLEHPLGSGDALAEFESLRGRGCGRTAPAGGAVRDRGSVGAVLPLAVLLARAAGVLLVGPRLPGCPVHSRRRPCGHSRRPFQVLTWRRGFRVSASGCSASCATG